MHVRTGSDVTLSLAQSLRYQSRQSELEINLRHIEFDKLNIEQSKINNMSTTVRFHHAYKDEMDNTVDDFPEPRVRLETPTRKNKNNAGDDIKLKRPEFKGTVEDFIMITNFKRFKRKGSSSRFKGVFYVKKEKKFRAQICLKGKVSYLFIYD